MGLCCTICGKLHMDEARSNHYIHLLCQCLQNEKNNCVECDQELDTNVLICYILYDMLKIKNFLGLNHVIYKFHIVTYQK